MKLNKKQKEMLSGKKGKAVKKAMEILVALGEIFKAKKLIPVKSVQVAGVSYLNLGDAGLEFLQEMAKDGRVKVKTTLNPAGMDLENWKKLGIKKSFAEKQRKVIQAFKKMKIITTCTCTPYFVGNKPKKGEHIAWSESSAVCYANSVLEAKTNREGGPSALAAALTGFTPEYGMHLDENRQAKVLVEVKTELKDVPDFGALGEVIGKKIGNNIPLITGIKKASTEQLKSLCASIATFGGTALFHLKGITPNKTKTPKKKITVTEKEIEKAKRELTDKGKVDFVAVGCPHYSLKELDELAGLVKGKKVRKEFWVCIARPLKKLAARKGIAKTIEEAGIKFACDTCMAVAPLKKRFSCMATDSAKACYYGRGSNGFKVKILPIEELVEEAIK